MLRLSDNEHKEQIIKRPDLWKTFDERIKPLEELGNRMIIRMGIKLSQRLIQRLKSLRYETNYHTSSEDRLKVALSIADDIDKGLKAHQTLRDLSLHDDYTVPEKHRGKKAFNSDNDWGSDNLSNRITDIKINED